MNKSVPEGKLMGTESPVETGGAFFPRLANGVPASRQRGLLHLEPLGTQPVTVAKLSLCLGACLRNWGDLLPV